MPDVKLEKRITKQWTDIGFQGEDPMTDFRGMGMLGLNQLLWVFVFYLNFAQCVYYHTAVVSISGLQFVIIEVSSTNTQDLSF